MNIDKKANYTLINSDEKDFTVFLKVFSEKINDLENEHLVIYFSENINTGNKDFLLFLDIAEQIKENGISFVIVCSYLNSDDFSESINIVPTLLEAEDILEMEAIERELGF